MSTPDERLIAESANDSELGLKRRVRRLSRRGFLIAAGAALTGAAAYEWLSTRPTEDGIPWPLRRMLDLNGNIASSLSSHAQLAPRYSATKARMPKVNGVIGLTNDTDAESWRLEVTGLADPGVPISLPLSDIMALPKVDLVTRLCCIEGWSEIVQWGGVRLTDLVKKYPMLLGTKSEAKYVASETPDGEYYVGLDMKSALHPQTLLCYEMNGAPLTAEHGAPLRLVLPHKYGIKNLKCVGSLAFVNERPDDYWAMRGYDYYAGL